MNDLASRHSIKKKKVFGKVVVFIAVNKDLSPTLGAMYSGQLNYKHANLWDVGGKYLAEYYMVTGRMCGLRTDWARGRD